MDFIKSKINRTPHHRQFSSGRGLLTKKNTKNFTTQKAIRRIDETFGDYLRINELSKPLSDHSKKPKSKEGEQTDEPYISSLRTVYGFFKQPAKIKRINIGRGFTDDTGSNIIDRCQYTINHNPIPFTREKYIQDKHEIEKFQRMREYMSKTSSFYFSNKRSKSGEIKVVDSRFIVFYLILDNASTEKIVKQQSIMIVPKMVKSKPTEIKFSEQISQLAKRLRPKSAQSNSLLAGRLGLLR